MNRRNHSFVMESELHDVKGRVDYISSPKRQENLYAVFSNVEDSYWDLLAEQNQRDFAKSGTEGTCIEARELIIMLPPSLIRYDHELLLKYMTSVFLEKYDVGCCAALHHNKSKTNALEVTKAMKLAKAELKKVQLAQKAWDAPETKP